MPTFTKVILQLLMKNSYFLIVPKTHPLDIVGPAQLFYECKDNGADLKLFFVSTTENTELESSKDGFFIT